MTDRAVLVTGAFGQVGRQCVRVLLARGTTVVGLGTRSAATADVAEALAAQGFPGQLIPAWADLRDAAAVAAIVAEHRPATIVHLAAVVAPAAYRDPAHAGQVNVTGTAHLLAAAGALPEPPLVLFASSAAVYGSRNPRRHPERITAATPVTPIDRYGADKVRAEALVTGSGLPHAVLRLAGVVSPDSAATFGRDHLVLVRAMPRDNRIHAVDARDVGLAFANAVDRRDRIEGRVLLIAGDDGYRHEQRALEDDLMAAIGIGRLGPGTGLPGDPADERGWSFTGWFDTTESQALLGYQAHRWPETVAWVAEGHARWRPVLRAVAPLVRAVLRGYFAVQRRRERRGRYADPWTLLARVYGPDILA